MLFSNKEPNRSMFSTLFTVRIYIYVDIQFLSAAQANISIKSICFNS